MNALTTHAAPVLTRPTPARPEPSKRVRKQPRYAVVLWNDDDHTYDYVVSMMGKLFGMDMLDGYRIARTVHHVGRAVCLVTTKEHAELKRDQIKAFGRDHLIDQCAGSMTASIEPVPES